MKHPSAFSIGEVLVDAVAVAKGGAALAATLVEFGALSFPINLVRTFGPMGESVRSISTTFLGLGIISTMLSSGSPTLSSS